MIKAFKGIAFELKYPNQMEDFGAEYPECLPEYRSVMPVKDAFQL